MFEDESFILLWCKGPLGISYPLFTKFYVYVKSRDLLVKVSANEKQFLLAVMAEWKRMGLQARELAHTDLFHDFSQAVSSRGRALWNSFFRSTAAQQTAATYQSYI
ncbi:hypothetical protein BTJ49_13415 [Oleiagrimonas sp. MCCC 1A03011]|nr:hypothetical protein BTJ49_13415 [Oleiagrimonas sp. MCCC 1A03011]